MIPLWPQRIRSALRDYVAPWHPFIRRRVPVTPFLENVTHRVPSTGRRALLVYLTAPFGLPDGHPALLKNQNLKVARFIARALDLRGYVVDVLDVTASPALPSNRAYDLVICHRVDFPCGAEGEAKRPPHIYLASGFNHVVNNRHVHRRYDEIEKTRGHRLTRRGVVPESMPFVKAADAIVGFGASFCARTWRELVSAPFFGFDNFGHEGTRFVERDWTVARRSFLFLASHAQVLKGLHLLLSIFSRHPELHLYVCSGFRLEPDFCHAYHRELYQTPNIHPLGMIRINGAAFYELARRCGFIILPSCSEGQPGSVVQGMHTGLIPIVTEPCGLEPGEAGIVLPDDSEPTIERQVLALSETPPATLAAMGRRSREAGVSRFSESAFSVRWMAILSEMEQAVLLRKAVTP